MFLTPLHPQTVVSFARFGPRSLGLLALALCASIVDCTSSVTFVSYLTGQPQTLVGALAFGEAFSDLVPSTVALAQGVGDDPMCVNKTGR